VTDGERSCRHPRRRWKEVEVQESHVAAGKAF
jgi:hypothetical protein